MRGKIYAVSIQGVHLRVDDVRQRAQRILQSVRALPAGHAPNELHIDASLSPDTVDADNRTDKYKRTRQTETELRRERK